MRINILLSNLILLLNTPVQDTGLWDFVEFSVIR